MGEASSFLKPPETVERAEEQLARVLSSEGPDVTRFQATVEAADGTALRCRDHMGVLPYEGERFRGSVGILRPVAVEEGGATGEGIDAEHLTDLLAGDAVDGAEEPADAREGADGGGRRTSPDGGVSVGRLPDGFYVEDDGPGILPGEREAGYTDDDGTGLGLAIATRVAESHGWTLSVAEGPDGGARFEVRGVEFAD